MRQQFQRLKPKFLAPETPTNPTEVPLPPENSNPYNAASLLMLGQYHKQTEKMKDSQLSQILSRHARNSGNPSANTGMARSILDWFKALFGIQTPSFLLQTPPTEEIQSFENLLSAFKQKYIVHMEGPLY
ncbi:hypothetical protein O181_098126 [Austropuccinia psidii MF-1]|uniref:Uncharacterized protein n=1 Tax=Austropuccinia psidii MF-1 TaxID=1389203 RepID=A0A9Q3PFP2_9BASI|nr:hypothetical protein [Austropuccinia psidii MF-1]